MRGSASLNPARAHYGSTRDGTSAAQVGRELAAAGAGAVFCVAGFPASQAARSRTVAAAVMRLTPDPSRASRFRFPRSTGPASTGPISQGIRAPVSS
jgi:hypothetical protein